MLYSPDACPIQKVVDKQRIITTKPVFEFTMITSVMITKSHHIPKELIGLEEKM